MGFFGAIGPLRILNRLGWRSLLSGMASPTSLAVFGYNCIRLIRFFCLKFLSFWPPGLVGLR